MSGYCNPPDRSQTNVGAIDLLLDLSLSGKAFVWTCRTSSFRAGGQLPGLLYTSLCVFGHRGDFHGLPRICLRQHLLVASLRSAATPLVKFSMAGICGRFNAAPPESMLALFGVSCLNDADALICGCLFAEAASIGTRSSHYYCCGRTPFFHLSREAQYQALLFLPWVRSRCRR